MVGGKEDVRTAAQTFLARGLTRGSGGVVGRNGQRAVAGGNTGVWPSTRGSTRSGMSRTGALLIDGIGARGTGDACSPIPPPPSILAYAPNSAVAASPPAPPAAVGGGAAASRSGTPPPPPPPPPPRPRTAAAATYAALLRPLSLQVLRVACGLPATPPPGPPPAPPPAASQAVQVARAALLGDLVRLLPPPLLVALLPPLAPGIRLKPAAIMTASAAASGINGTAVQALDGAMVTGDITTHELLWTAPVRRHVREMLAAEERAYAEVTAPAAAIPTPDVGESWGTDGRALYTRDAALVRPPSPVPGSSPAGSLAAPAAPASDVAAVPVPAGIATAASVAAVAAAAAQVTPMKSTRASFAASSATMQPGASVGNGAAAPPPPPPVLSATYLPASDAHPAEFWVAGARPLPAWDSARFAARVGGSALWREPAAEHPDAVPLVGGVYLQPYLRQGDARILDIATFTDGLLCSMGSAATSLRQATAAVMSTAAATPSPASAPYDAEFLRLLVMVASTVLSRQGDVAGDAMAEHARWAAPVELLSAALGEASRPGL